VLAWWRERAQSKARESEKATKKGIAKREREKAKRERKEREEREKAKRESESA
jgi:hypothetical protein